MSTLLNSLIELIRRTSAEIPDDVHKAILTSLENEKKESLAANAMKIIDQNIALAKNKSQPICQDTGSILFYVDCPVGFDQPSVTGLPGTKVGALAVQMALASGVATPCPVQPNPAK